MLRTFLRSKIHRATVTDSDLNYVGSLGIAPELMAAAGIRVNEFVYVVNIDTGARFETYAIEAGPGEIVCNGAAARLVQRGDIVVIFAYGQFTEQELAEHEPRIVHVDEHNHIRETVLTH
jgi:aspartate 1-decarboxylase